jgi:sec-independent protein translocase protein TatC
MARTKPYPPDAGQPLISHLVELRGRLLRILAAVVVVFLLLFPFANELYALLARPLLTHLPQGGSMIATEVASPFLAPFKFTMVLAFFVAIPLVLYQVWGFIAPGLYQNERRLVLPLLMSSTLLFYTGMAFAYFVVFPLIFEFLVNVAPVGVTVMTDISKYLEFVLKLFFAFGMAFEVPIATIVLVWAGITTPEELVAKRPYVIVASFVIGMLLTPPDMISQTLLAVPMWLLFEAGILFSRFFVRDTGHEEEAEDGPQDATGSDADRDGG